MTHKKIVSFSIIGAVAAIVLIAQQSATEAPAGFTTPTLGQAIGPTGELTEIPVLRASATGSPNRPATLSPSIRHNLNGHMIQVPD